MAISGFLFISWRFFEIVMTIPIVGMLSWVVKQYVDRNLLTPTYVLVEFIVSVLALVWALFTVISYFRARHDALFVAFVDICFVGAFIAGVVLLRGWGTADCGNISAEFTSTGATITVDLHKWCSLLKASFALGIIDIIAFTVTFLLALLVHRHHRNDDRVVVRREYHGSRHSHRRSGSRDYRSSREYASRGGSRSGRSHYSSSRRQPYV